MTNTEFLDEIGLPDRLSIFQVVPEGSTIWAHTEWQKRDYKRADGTPYVYVHKAVDIPVPTGTEIRSPGPGIIDNIFWQKEGAGNGLMVKYPKMGLVLYFFHLDKYAVGLEEQQSVAAGEVLGYTGATGHVKGPHLHLEVLYKGFKIRPSWLFNLK